jgi:hypothetical protein
MVIAMPPMIGSISYTEKYLVEDKRLPGYVTGYVRRFWQVCCQGSVMGSLQC